MSEIAVRHGDANNHHLPQRAIGHVCPVEALAQWQLKQPELFVSEVSNLPGLDTYSIKATALTWAWTC